MVKAALAIAVVIIAAIAAALCFQTGTQVPLNNQPDAYRYQVAENSLDEGQRSDMAAPEKVRWEGGDTGLFKLALRNGYEQEKQYFLNMYLEKLDGELAGRPVQPLAGTVSWFAYPASVNTGPGGRALVSISMKVPQDAPFGAYVFRILVCETQDCTGYNSPGVYTSEIISMMVE